MFRAIQRESKAPPKTTGVASKSINLWPVPAFVHSFICSFSALWPPATV